MDAVFFEDFKRLVAKREAEAQTRIEPKADPPRPPWSKPSGIWSKRGKPKQLAKPKVVPAKSGAVSATAAVAASTEKGVDLKDTGAEKYKRPVKLTSAAAAGRPKRMKPSPREEELEMEGMFCI